MATHFPEQAARLAGYIENVGSQIAAIVTHNPRTIAGLQKKYSVDAERGRAKIRVVLIPGHEPGYGGAEYGDLKERDLTVQLAGELANFLRMNSKYEVVIARDDKAWNPIFQNYFDNSWDSIIEWQKAHKAESLRQVTEVDTDFVPKVHHNSAPNDVAYRLYGITKWSNENAVDIAVHIHFNDYPGHGWKIPGEYSGFSIYVPEAQYLNSTTTRAIAETVFKRLAKYNAVSDFQGESAGIVDERELIAIGANNTADAASLLVEYAYLYEQQIANPETRTLALKDLAYQTYLGLEDFFNQGKATVASTAYDTLTLPHTWSSPLSETVASMGDVYALQTALLLDGVYPPGNRSKNDCPRTGKIGPCTKEAIKEFQNKYGLEVTGTIGPKTLEKLNGLYSVKPI
ncbi:MAG: putative peptidoglycan binding domain [Candidatus Parcubacteria bacterium]